MVNRLLTKTSLIGAGLFSTAAAMAANVQISGQIDTYVESYTAGNETTVQSYQTGLFSRDAVQLSGGENLIAALSERGVLRVEDA